MRHGLRQMVKKGQMKAQDALANLEKKGSTALTSSTYKWLLRRIPREKQNQDKEDVGNSPHNTGEAKSKTVLTFTGKKIVAKKRI